MNLEQIKNRMIQLETDIRILEPQAVKKSNIDVEYAVKTGQLSIAIAEHNMLNALLGIHEKLEEIITKIPKELI